MPEHQGGTMQGKLFVAVIAALAGADAGAADWTHVLGSNPSFPTQLAERGLAIDEDGQVAVQTYNRLPWSGQIEFTHEYTLAADGSIPWIWGLVGRNGSLEMTPRGVDQRDGYRLVWLERAVDPFSIHDELALVNPGSSQPDRWLVEPRVNGRVAKIVSAGNDGAFALRALDGGAGFELIAFDGPLATWRVTAQPCAPGIEPTHLAIEFVPAMAWPALPGLTVAGQCDDGFTPSQVFAQRFDPTARTSIATQWLNATPGSTLEALAFSPRHELVAVYATPWPHREVQRIAAPNERLPPPLEFLFGFDQVTGLSAGGDALAIIGTDPAGEPVVATVMQGQPTTMPQALPDLATFPGGGWSIVAGRDGKLLALRVESAGVPIVRLAGLDAYGHLEWSSTITDVLPGSVPQAVPAKDAAGGFVVAVDTLDATGTIGVQVQRVGSTP
jgi:hypothetical protein